MPQHSNTTSYYYLFFTGFPLCPFPSPRLQAPTTTATPVDKETHSNPGKSTTTSFIHF